MANAYPCLAASIVIDFDAFFDEIRIVDAAGLSLSLARKDAGSIACMLDTISTLPNAILRALIDRERDDEALLRRIVFADRRNHAHVGIAVLQIEPAKQISIGFDAVGIVDVGRLQEAEKVALRGLDFVLQAPYEKHALPTKRMSLTPVFSPSWISNTRSTRLFGSSMIFGSTRDVETAVAMINLDDALHVGLDGRARQRAARL